MASTERPAARGEPPGSTVVVDHDPSVPSDAGGAVPHRPLGTIRRRPSGQAPPLPKHFDRWTLLWLVFAGLAAVVWLVVAFNTRLSSWVDVEEGMFIRWLAGQRRSGLSDGLARAYDLLYTWAVPVVGWSTLIVLAVYRRWRHALVYLGSLLATVVVVAAIAGAAQRPRPYQVVILGRWENYSHPSAQLASLTAVLVGSGLALLPPGRGRKVVPWFIGLAIGLYALTEWYLGVTHPTDDLTAVLVGVTIPILAFRMFAPEEVFPVAYRVGNSAHLDVTGARGSAIRQAFHDQLGLEVLGVKPVGLAGSAGSTPLMLTVRHVGAEAPGDGRSPPGGGDTGEFRVFAKLLARSHLRADRWYKLFRTLRYGRLEDEYRFTTVRRLVSQEDYLALRLAAAGVRVPRSYGVVEITPEREYMVVTEFLDGFVEIGDAEIDVALIDNALHTVRQLWDAGIAHRDVKPSNVMVRGDDVALIDVAFGQLRPSPWRQAVDLANMMLVLALRSSAELVYQRACLQFSETEIAEAFAASRGITLPSQIRHEMKQQGRDLVVEFRRLAPPCKPIPIQRWSVRRVALMAWVLLATVVLVWLSITYLSVAGMLP